MGILEKFLQENLDGKCGGDNWWILEMEELYIFFFEYTEYQMQTE